MEESEERRLRLIMEQLIGQKYFGASAVQKACRIGYTIAAWVIERGIEEGLLTRPLDDHRLQVSGKGLQHIADERRLAALVMDNLQSIRRVLPTDQEHQLYQLMGGEQWCSQAVSEALGVSATRGSTLLSELHLKGYLSRETENRPQGGFGYLYRRLDQARGERVSLFQCAKCGCCENTAQSWQGFSWVEAWDWAGLEEFKGRELCIACGPDHFASGKKSHERKWHMVFPRFYLEPGKWETNCEGSLEHVETGATDYYNHALRVEHEQCVNRPLIG